MFFGFYKTRHILLSDSANCTMLHAVVLTQYWRVTDGWTDGLTDGRTDSLRQTDGIAVASTALAMRALQRAVKTLPYKDRLMHSNLPTLKYRRLRADMIEVFNITHNTYDAEVSPNLRY